MYILINARGKYAQILRETPSGWILDGCHFLYIFLYALEFSCYICNHTKVFLSNHAYKTAWNLSYIWMSFQKSALLIFFQESSLTMYTSLEPKYVLSIYLSEHWAIIWLSWPFSRAFAYDYNYYYHKVINYWE